MRPHKLFLCLLFVLVARLKSAQNKQAKQGKTDWNAPFPPHKVIGNVYFVGSAELASFLITTPQGDILINSDFEATVPVIRASVEKLGFKFTDIKIMLGSHAHGDHMEGDALVKELSGARVMAMEQDVPWLRKMTPGNKPHPIDQILKDGEQVTLGGDHAHSASHRRPHPRLHHLDHESGGERQVLQRPDRVQRRRQPRHRAGQQ